MKQKLVALGVVMVMAAVFAARVPSVYADPFSSVLEVSLLQCGAGDPSCANPGDGIVQTGESVGTTVHTALPSDGGSFYDAIRTVYTGVTPSTTVPASRVIGSGTFLIHLSVGTKCSGASGFINPTYNIYSTQDANSVTYPSLGYAKGLTGSETWATFSTAGWVQDFDDDNNNNVPDFIDTAPGTGTSTLPMTVRDLNPANGVPDGADKEPLFLPLLDQITGVTHSTRAFGDAVVVAGSLEVGVDFVTYKDFPSVGTNTQIAAIQEGAGLGLLPSNNSTASTSTCPPFTSDVTFNNKSAAGDLVQTATGSPISYSLQFSVAADIDGDGVADYQDNCDLVPNPTQTDTDGNGIGDACDTGVLPTPPGTATDWDADGFPNYIDACPYAKNTGDSDTDGIDDACDPAPAVAGDGYGYASPAPGDYHDHDQVDSASIPLPYAIAGNPVTGTGTSITDSNDNFVADGSESAGTALGSGVKPGDSDGDGLLDNVDPDPLDPGARSGKCSVNNDCEHDTGQARWLNMYGDGCNNTDEATLSLSGNPLSTTSPWDFADFPVPALFSAASPLTDFRTSGTLSAGMAQADFAWFSKNIKFPSPQYNADRNKNNVMDGVEYDRSAGALPGAPDGVFSATEAQKAFSEFKANLKCPSGGYRQNDTTWNHP